MTEQHLFERKRVMLLWVEFTSDKTEVSATSLFAYRLLCADKRARNSKAVDFSPLAQMRFLCNVKKRLRAECEGQGVHLPEDTFSASNQDSRAPVRVKSADVYFN